MDNKCEVLRTVHSKYSLNASYYEISGIEQAKTKPSS